MVLNIRNNLKEKPIRLACMERGPGPGKYCLPGTCGVVLTHDPRKHTKPSYSFGTKHKLHNDFNRSPGPVYFVPPNLTRKGLRGAPRYSLVGRRRSPTLSCAPGPGVPNDNGNGLMCWFLGWGGCIVYNMGNVYRTNWMVAYKQSIQAYAVLIYLSSH